jgi:hypothetical protein
MSTKVTDESLKKCPPNLKRLLALHNNSFTHAGKALGGVDRSNLARIARGNSKLSPEMSAKVDAALAKANGHDTAPAKPLKKGGSKARLAASHPLLEELLGKYNGWTPAARALGFRYSGKIYNWNKNPEAFTEEWQQRVRDLLDGKEIAPIRMRTKSSKSKGLDTGDLGIAIVISAVQDIERLLDVAEPMGGKGVFRKKLSDGTWIVIFRFGDKDDMMAFKAWGEKRAEVVTP